MAPRGHCPFLSYGDSYRPGRRGRERLLDKPGHRHDPGCPGAHSFAAANRLCVDLGYLGEVQRVEPYSLRRNRDGDVVLYAREVGTATDDTYRTSGIAEVEITRQTFVPKYANELLPPSPEG